MLRRLVVQLALAHAVASAGLASSPAFAAPKAVSAEEVYALGLKYLKRGYYTKALEQFNRVRTFFRDDPYSLKAELAIADIHYKKNEWDQARVAYEDFMRAHPRYPELDVVVYRLGMTLYKKAPLIPDRDQTWTRQVVNTWAGFPARFPESTHREEVDRLLGKARGRLAEKELRIAAFYERRNAWLAVTGRIEPLLRTWPEYEGRAAALELLGTAQHQLGDAEAAAATMERLQADFPGSSEATGLRRTLSKPPSPGKVGRTG